MVDVSEVASMVRQLQEYMQRGAAEAGSNAAVRPSHRTPFHWPPHPVSYGYNVHPTDWTGTASFTSGGETFTVEVARTPFGIFGRSPELWHEARGENLEEMLRQLQAIAEPLLRRQRMINATREVSGRFTGHFRDLPPLDLLKLLYCPDRDVAHSARVEIETQASNPLWFPCFVAILEDTDHPHRRSAQWCVLDLFEALPTFVTDEDDLQAAIRAMKHLLWTAEDDYARTIYKAGVVLGGHIPDQYGGPTLLECLQAPSAIGRRSAIHGLFHVVEWMPDTKELVLKALAKVGETDPEPILRQYAKDMARDIERGEMDHVLEPNLPNEP